MLSPCALVGAVGQIAEERRAEKRERRHMIVTRADLERQIERVRQEVRDPVAGIYGPGSASWAVNREAALFLCGGKAALLQLAHPFVAHAVDQHSATRTDPLGRFKRTFDNVYGMVFGDWDTVVRSARRVHAIHQRIHGTITEDVGAFRAGAPYHANDERALFWVHATLMDGAVEAHELVFGPMAPDHKERYYRESRRFARLFGISDAVMPSSWSAFRDYFDGMLASDTISVGRTAREIAGFLFQSPRGRFVPLFHWVETLTAGLLPPRIRAELGLPWTARHRALHAVSLRAVRRAYPRLPRRLRYVPAYVRARRRLDGIEGPDRVGDLLERLVTAPLARQG
jgi:uncharacterized protein (DUF2236 family)